MIGSLMMCVSAVVLLLGMLGGMAMGIQQNFTLAPAHAHLNLTHIHISPPTRLRRIGVAGEWR